LGPAGRALHVCTLPSNPSPPCPTSSKGQVILSNALLVRAVAPLDLVVLQRVEANLAKWNSQADEEAFGDF